MVKVISDSTSDLGRSLMDRYDVEMIPLHVYLGEEEYLDGVNISPDQIYRWADEHNTTPKTSAPNLEDVIGVFDSHLKAGDDLIVFTVSSSMSSSYNVCRLAVEELEAADRIKIIDSANLSTGVGLLVIEAAIMASKGQDLGAIEEQILKYRPLVRASFVVDTLVYLYRGGRCSGLAALAGSALKIHPRIVVENGAMRSDRKYRGSLDKSILTYVQDMEEQLVRAKKDRVFITHSGCESHIVDQVRAYLSGLERFDEIIETRAGGVISSHCGPATLGVLFIAGED
ncbi:MAG: DegV family protein [Lachnospiraceae bacterium]|nr:DegV family protein [Lachnospiraceae bacterium]